MNGTTMSPEETLLVAALAADAERATVSSDALARIEQRIASGDELAVLRAARRRRLRTTAVAALVAAVLLGAATIGAIGYGLRSHTAPDPIDRPTPTTTAVPGGGDLTADPAPATMTVYRYRPAADGGSGRLSLEYVRNVRPYDPKRALDALFDTLPLFPKDSSVLNNGRNQVASTTETATQIVVDMAAVDDQRPAGTAPVSAYLQAWRKTIQEAYHSDKPVFVRSNGQPTRLYGSFDTTKALPTMDLPASEPRGIFLPRPGETVSSPLSIVASTPDGTFRIDVVNRSTGEVVHPDGVAGRGGYVGLGGIDLPAGDYRVTLRNDPSTKTATFRASVDFTVQDDLPTAAAPSPAVDPETTPVDTVAVYFPSEDHTHLVREWRVRGQADRVLSDYLRYGSGLDSAGSTLLGGTAGVRSVRSTGSGPVLVDLGGPLFGTAGGAPAKVVDLQDQAFARTVGSVLGEEGRAVRVTVDGQPVETAGRVWRDGPVTPRTFRIVQEDGPTPQPPLDTEWTPIIGSVASAQGTTTYQVFDAVSQEPVAIGRVPQVDPSTRRYAFGIRLPAGRYTVHVTSPWKDSRETIAGDLTIEP